MDLNPMVNNFLYRLSNGTEGRDIKLSEDYFKSYLTNTNLKNGFVMTILEFSTMNAQMEEMIQMSENLLALIDSEITK